MAKLIFEPSFEYFTIPTAGDKILAWKSKWFSEENIKPPDTSDNNLTAKLYFIHNAKIGVKPNESCLK